MLGLVIAGGEGPNGDGSVDVPAADVVVAADRGVGLARRLGIAPTLVVGDFDSADSADLDWARAAGAGIERHEVAKDLTDLELALAAAGAAGATRLVVLGAGGGRVDHELGNWAAIAGADVPQVEVRGPGGTTHVVRDRLDLPNEAGGLVSIVPWGGPAVVTTRGLRWELDAEELSPFEARGISNVVEEPPVRIDVISGVALVVCPVAP